MNKQLQIWVDADACPVVIKEMLYNAAKRANVTTTFVANTFLRVPPSLYIKTLEVPKGFDVADNKIIAMLTKGDLVVTADIPLASFAIKKDAFALNPRGEFYSKENIQERLAMRDMMEELRASGVETSGPSAFKQADRKAFAAQLDKFLRKHTRN